MMLNLSGVSPGSSGGWTAFNHSFGSRIFSSCLCCIYIANSSIYSSYSLIIKYISVDNYIWQFVVQSDQATETKNAETAKPGLRKAEDVVTSMLAKGFILGKDALSHAKAFDEKHQFTSTATAKVVSLDQKVGLSEKISAGTTLVNEKVKEMNEKFQVSEKTKSAISAAEQSVSNAGSAIMKNRYVLTGATWVTGAYNKVAKAAEEVGQKTKEKVMTQDNQGETESHVHTNMPEPQHATTANQPSKPESQQDTVADKPSNPATTQGSNLWLQRFVYKFGVWVMLYFITILMDLWGWMVYIE